MCDPAHCNGAICHTVGLIVSEMLGNLVDNEGCPGILADAVTRFLAPGGRRLPWRAQRHLVPDDTPRAHASLAARRAHHGPTDPTSSFDSYYDVILPRTAYLASPRTDRTFELDAHAATAYRSELVFHVDRPGRLTGSRAGSSPTCHRRSPSTSPATASTAAPPPARQPMEDPRSPQPARGQPAPAARSSPIRSALVG
jgi:hypothetical protein